MFERKKIRQPNCSGNLLQEARLKTGLSLKMIAKHIKIDKKYLEALECNAWHKLPGEVYAKNFLKKYCSYLKINPATLKIDWSSIDDFKTSRPSEDFKKKARPQDLLNLPKTLRAILILLAALAIIIYLIWQINFIISAPEIEIFYPANDITTPNNILILTGKTEHEVKLKINDQEIILESDNTFSQTLNLSPGLNIIKIEGKKKYSKTQILERRVIYESLN